MPQERLTSCSPLRTRLKARTPSDFVALLSGMARIAWEGTPSAYRTHCDDRLSAATYRLDSIMTGQARGPCCATMRRLVIIVIHGVRDGTQVPGLYRNSIAETRRLEPSGDPAFGHAGGRQG